jgi:hypothetical protein
MMIELSPTLVEAALLHFAGEEWHDPYWYSWDQWGDLTGKTYDIPGLGKVKIVGYNGTKDISYAEHSEVVWLVFDVGGTLYRKSGTHTSYVGTEWHDGMQIVKPVERTVIDYVEVE